MIRTPLPTVEFLRECFSYQKSTGEFRWKRRPKSHFETIKGWKVFNALYAGKAAFTSVDTDGYHRGVIDGRGYAAHRVIWKLVTGNEPPDYIDHRDRRVTNNRWCNLREATQGENFINRVSSWGKEGVAGVRQQKNKNSWDARIQKDKKYVHIGTFSTREEAIAARRRKAVELFGVFAE